MVVLLILHLEFQPLPENFRSTSVVEQIFRRPAIPYAKIRLL